MAITINVVGGEVTVQSSAPSLVVGFVIDLGSPQDLQGDDGITGQVANLDGAAAAKCVILFPKELASVSIAISDPGGAGFIKVESTLDPRDSVVSAPESANWTDESANTGANGWAVPSAEAYTKTYLRSGVTAARITATSTNTPRVTVSAKPISERQV